MIKWESRISKDDKYIDLQGLKNYSFNLSEKSKNIRVYEYDVTLPEEPADEDCVNYGLKEYDQIFRLTYIPKQVSNPSGKHGKEAWKKEKLDAFIDVEWNRRRNGIWMFIKGRKTYIPGLLYMKMNYWKSVTGAQFLYKHSDLEFFLFWMHCVHDPLCDGMADFKCRQLGDTENVVLIMWEYGSRVRGTLNAIQSCINEGHAQRAYIRLVHGHKKMIYYFRPLNQGTEDPKKGLNLSYPAEAMTLNKVKEKSKDGGIANRSSEDDYEYPEIGSRFLYGPTKLSENDGSTLGRAYLDEFAKSDGKLNPIDWLQTIREATYSKILNRKMGLILMTSTAEDIGADSLAWAEKIWKQADPSKRTGEGRTANGLYRCFRNVVARGDVDRWGDPLTEKIIAEVKSAIKILMDSGDVKGAIKYKRKNCITIDDVFQSANDESQFDIEKLSKRFYYIQNTKQIGSYGNLKWKDGIPDTEVVWEPNSKGKWYITKHPKDFGLQANKKVTGVLAPKPGNTFYFRSGLDPYDQATTLDENPSLGAFVVKRILDEVIDGGTERYYQFNDEERGIRIGDPVDNGADFITNRYVCDYLFREADPNDFFEHVILTMVYYGTDFLPEKDRFGGLHSYIKNRGYELYLMEKPSNYKNQRGQTERDGASATVNNLDQYFGLLTTLSCKWANTIDHPRILEQLLSMNYKNRGKKDLGVSCGWCEYATMVQVRRHTPAIQSEMTHFTENWV